MRNLLSLGTQKRGGGYTLIELLVVITLMAIVGASVAASYITFEKNQRIDEAVQIVKSVVRQAQNNAVSGKNITSGNPTGCPTGTSLEGWFILFTKSANNFSGNGVCSDLTMISPPVVGNLPQGVTVGDVLYGSPPVSVASQYTYVFFRTVGFGASFHANQPFIDANSGDLLYLLGAQPQGNLTIRLSDGSTTRDVVIDASGDVQ